MSVYEYGTNNNNQHRTIATKSVKRFIRSSSLSSSSPPAASSPLTSSSTSSFDSRSFDAKDGDDTEGTGDGRRREPCNTRYTDESKESRDDHRCKRLLDMVRDRCLCKGGHGIHELGVMFRHLDIDYNKRITFHEMKDTFEEYGLDMTVDDVHFLFRTLDSDRSGGIDFVELMTALRSNMNDGRANLINEAFNSVDIGGNGTIDLDEIKVVYAANARRHPKYLSGEWTEEETLRYFLDSLDTPGSPDGKVTRQEFMNYYAGVSATVDDDCYFDMMMRSVYGLPAVSRSKQTHSK